MSVHLNKEEDPVNASGLASTNPPVLHALQPDAATTLHVQAERAIRALAGQAPYRDGELLPDELTLAARLGVSRGTVRTAIMRLVTQGLLARRPGVGTRVVGQPETSAIVAWRSLTREMAAKGIEVQNFEVTAHLKKVNAAVARALSIDEGRTALRLDRLRGWEGRPVLHSRSWFHPRLKLGTDGDFGRPLYEMIEQVSGVVAESAREQLTAVPASRMMAKKLQLRPGVPLLLRRHIVMDAAQRPFEVADVHYVSERYALTIDLKRGDR